MENEIMKLMITQGGYAVLFCYLLWYVLKTSKEREEKMQNTIDKNQQVISDLARKFDILEDVKDSVNKIEEKLG
ncbi:BhlA/UviB family holin-like peptide [Clostridium cochlearium]|uniref:BhlA/UviB family holin-like peptide n=1 Tax=Clostridium cochlearium TaxID=1494 RepID=UPI00156D5955|nr:BhlA/UviB family holin-like peptide [Clostridium cochlearium]MCG4571797.1 bacteriocin [Clostridium cochlearium]MCG4579126.1 bacteriocin [Clostridium cochlearium]NSJ90117.1 bacteriocin [Coprococcus sp. MSK.21.13]